MDYYSPKEITEEYNVSAMTVSRWITNAKVKKNSLMLYNINGKYYIIRNANNKAELERLSIVGKNHKPGFNLKKSKPRQEFYDTFNDEQILAIINSIETSSEIPSKYTYLNGGAEIWDKFYHENAVLTNNYPTPKRITDLLVANSSFVDFIAEDFESINIIDIGQGNSLLVIEFLKFMKSLGKLNKYVVMDISARMNDIAIENVKRALPDLPTRGYVCDADVTNFDKLFFENSDEDNSINIILYLGSMIGNCDDPVRVLHNFRLGMRKQDVLFVSNTVSSSINKVDFSYIKKPEVDDQHTWIPAYFGIDIGDCELVTKYDQRDDKRKLNLKLDKNYEIEFNLLGRKKLVLLEKGQEITIWKHELTKLERFIKQLSDADLSPINVSLEKDNSHMLAMCKVIHD